MDHAWEPFPPTAGWLLIQSANVSAPEENVSHYLQSSLTKIRKDNRSYTSWTLNTRTAKKMGTLEGQISEDRTRNYNGNLLLMPPLRGFNCVQASENWKRHGGFQNSWSAAPSRWTCCPTIQLIAGNQLGSKTTQCPAGVNHIWFIPKLTVHEHRPLPLRTLYFLLIPNER